MSAILSDVNIPALVAVLVAPFVAYLFTRSVAHPLVEQISGKEHPKPRRIHYLIAFIFILVGTILLLLGY